MEIEWETLVYSTDMGQDHEVMQNASLETRYAADCEQLLGRVRCRFRRDFEVPAEVVREAIAVSGFRIVFEEMEDESDLGFCDSEERRVVILKDFESRLHCPWAADRVLNFTLALTELGHVWLHGASAPEWGVEAGWKEEATLYARVFLIPRPLLMTRVETHRLLDSPRASQADLWDLVLELADFFVVSGKFMVHTLDAYGLIQFDPTTRWIAVTRNYCAVSVRT